jgi:hypothetical protein
MPGLRSTVQVDFRTFRLRDDGRTGLSFGFVIAMKQQDSCCFPKGSVALFLLET